MRPSVHTCLLLRKNMPSWLLLHWVPATFNPQHQPSSLAPFSPLIVTWEGTTPVGLNH